MSDPDAIFTIDPTTRVISTNVKKIVLMQYDHNSEIFTFSIPRFVEGHDMSLCNKIEIHYTNINKRTREQSKDVYPVTDKKVESDNLAFTWLLSGNATKYPGSLNFIIRFKCVEDDGSISYMWNTDIFKNVTVSDGISNTETVIEDYSDILEQWKSELINEIPQSDYEQNDSTAKDYIKNRPFYTEVTETTLLDGTFDFVENNGLYMTISKDFPVFLEEGKTYTIIFDGTSYSCVGYIPVEGFPIFLGNISLSEPELTGGNNEPFVMENASDVDSSLGIATNLTDSSHTVKITGPVETIKKLDAKYLPDDIYTQIQTAKITAETAKTAADSAKTAVDTKMNKNNPTGIGSFSMGRHPRNTKGEKSFAVGDYVTASGNSSHAEGYYTTAKGAYSHAEGKNTTAEKDSSHAEGNYTTASGIYSHAEGNHTKASGAGSHVEGNTTTASAAYAHAEGNQTQANGEYSHAEGDHTTAGKDSSHAEGYYAVASSKYQHVQGKYNVIDSSDVYADIIGNGTSGSNRSNAHTVDWSGNAWYAGDVYVGSTSGTNKDAGSKKLATEEYVSAELENYTPDPSLGITNATVGQIAKITAVDSNGKPTAWEPVDMPSGDKWELIHQGTVGENGVTSYLVNTDMNGNPFSLSEFELTYTIYNPAGYASQKAGGLGINGLTKSSFSTNGNASSNDSYTGCIGSDSKIDVTKGVHMILKYEGSVVDGYLMMRGFSSGYGYDSDGNIVSLSGTSGAFGVGKWNDIVSKGQLFNDGVSSLELIYYYDSLKNATITIKGVRA